MRSAGPGAAPLCIEWDPALVEAAVHLVARGDLRRWRVYRKTLDPLYDAPDRERTIPPATFSLFREWGLGRPVDELLRTLPVVEAAGRLAAGRADGGRPAGAHASGAVAPGARALLARSRAPGDEGADLLVGDGVTLLVRLQAERFLDQAALVLFLRHELAHVRDMLDPAFGYRPDLGLSGRTLAEKELVRGRYRVLWNLAIDQTETCPVSLEARQLEFDRAFAALLPGQRERLAERFRSPALRRHDALLAAARDPWAFLGEGRHGPVAGQPCPLCAFPTHDWDPRPPAATIRAEVPTWEAAMGACRQCADIYRILEAAAPAASA